MRNRRGESMIFTVVVTGILLTLGIAVLTAAASAVNAQSRRAADQQAYYAALSAMEVLEDSLENGALGEKLLGELETAAVSGGTLPETVLTPDMTLEGLEGVTFREVSITYTGSASVTDQAGGQPSRLRGSFSSVVLTLTAVAEDRDYTLSAKYAYTGNAVRGTDWEWEGTWSLKLVK